ncbi:PAS domain-containing protein [Methanoculleus sp. Wushi-C6]|uniref:histidine kinase n=1 Tax=Methanoculleus caldifontis TaxID=2651577 RepID=A0ABU3X2E7_9EURY|nr:PAS domain-containing protein [Methanoculleus sp. Wushi-C6]MDV2482228.1 PAS domain-containing protein [Methanoculleus sp. Wushi-C6]
MVSWYEMLTLLYFLATATVVLLGAFILGKNAHSRIHQIFFLASLTWAFWAFSEFMQHTLEGTAAADPWIAAEAIWILDTAVALHFILLFVKSPYLHASRTPRALAPLYVPAIVFLCVVCCTDLFIAALAPASPGLDGLAAGDLVVLLAYLWALICAGIGWILCIRYVLRTPAGGERRQAALVAIGLTVPVISGFSYLASDAVPWLMVFELPPVTALWFSLFVGYAIWKHGLFIITPQTTADTIISTMNDGLLLLDDHNRVLETNAALTTMLGRDRPDLIGIPAETLFSNRLEAADIFSAVLTAGSVPDRETVLQRRDGRPLPVSLSGAAVGNDDGGVAGIVMIVRDIAERKMHENALSESNRKLALLSSITRHDLLNQVMVIRGHLHFASEDTEDAAVRDRLAKCDAAAALIQQQAEFTRDYQDLGQQSPVWQKVSSVVAAEAAAFRGVPVTIRADTDGTEIYADPLFSRVVYNLIDNALRHGGNVTAISFSVRQDNGSAILRCEDNGEGVLPGEKEGLFRWGVGRNTGHGLFLSREILAITGIEIQETGSPGSGARFEMRIPEGNIRYGEA